MNFLHTLYNTITSPASNIKFHGLINQGAMCYLNSVLQVLFMTKDFRDAVTRYLGTTENPEFIDHHLKDLFDNLQYDIANTDKITEKLGIKKVWEQRDAAECFERLLRLTSPKASQIFHGMLINKVTCSKCHTDTDRDAPFWHLPLTLEDSYINTSENKIYRAVDGIEQFFKPTHLNGENQMYCDKCEGKVDAKIRAVIKHHPDVLILLLKRFKFNYHYMSYVKINSFVDIPFTLRIPESLTYELYAVINHFGDLRSGHYTSTIRIQDEHEDRWYKFDDTKVTELDYQQDNTKKSDSAYLLFYRKEKNADSQDAREISTSGDFTPSNTDNCDQCKNIGKEVEDAEETQLQENVKGHKNAGKVMVNEQSDFKLEASDKLAKHGRLNKQDEMNNRKRKLTDLSPEKNEQTEKKGKSLTKPLNSHANHRGGEGLDKPKDNQRHKQGSSSRSQIEENEKGVKKDIIHEVREYKHNISDKTSAQKDVDVETQTRNVRADEGEKRGAGKYSLWKKNTVETRDHSEAIKHYGMRKSDNVGQNTTENTTVTHTPQRDVNMEEQTKEQKK